MIDITILAFIGIECSNISRLNLIEELDDQITIEVRLKLSDEDICPKCGCCGHKIKDYSTKNYSYYGLVNKT